MAPIALACCNLKTFDMLGRKCGRPLRTCPKAHSVDEFCRLRSYWLPARGPFLGSFGGGGGVRNNLLWKQGPMEFERRWEAFQRVVQQIWQAAGVDSTKTMMRLAWCYNQHAQTRQRVLRCWEATHMSQNDKPTSRTSRAPSSRTARAPRMKRSAAERVSMNLKAVAWLCPSHRA